MGKKFIMWFYFQWYDTPQERYIIDFIDFYDSLFSWGNIAKIIYEKEQADTRINY